MTKRVQILNKEWLQLDIINKDWTVSNKQIEYRNVVEITDNCLKSIEYYKPNSYRLVDKPKQRYLTNWIVWIWTAIIWTVIWTIIGKFIL